MSGWFDVVLYSITVGTLLIQIYLFWLIVNKTPKRMQSFRFCLFMLMLNEFLFSISIGFVVDPDLLLFDAGFQGGIVNGVARFLGPEGGRYGFALAMFFGAGVFCNQINCLMFRYTAIQQNHPNLNAKFNKWNCRICLCIFAYSICAVCAILGFNAMADVKEINYIITHPYHMNEEMAEKMAPNGTVYILLSSGDGMREFGFFITGAYSLATILSIAFSGLIYHTINRNSAHFTARTFRLHLQLTALLIVQFCLPILFLMGPVGYAFVSVILYLPVPGYTGQISILLLSLYTMANSFVSLLFVTPYREHTLRICRLKKVAAQTKRLSLKTTQHPLGQLPLNKIVAMAELQPVVDSEKNSD